jgi:hypothetical protein
MAKMDKLTTEEAALMHVLNWMEVAYEGTAVVLDVDYETGAVTLFGPESAAFRLELNKIMGGVYRQVPAWR